jgi:hypothetical protein
MSQQAENIPGVVLDENGLINIKQNYDALIAHANDYFARIASNGDNDHQSEERQPTTYYRAIELDEDNATNPDYYTVRYRSIDNLSSMLTVDDNECEKADITDALEASFAGNEELTDSQRAYLADKYIDNFDYEKYLDSEQHMALERALERSNNRE